jgi:hypothetical protein
MQKICTWNVTQFYRDVHPESVMSSYKTGKAIPVTGREGP